jgi:hypothetical protein
MFGNVGTFSLRAENLLPEAWTLEQLGKILHSASKCEGMVGEVPAYSQR